MGGWWASISPLFKCASVTPTVINVDFSQIKNIDFIKPFKIMFPRFLYRSALRTTRNIKQARFAVVSTRSATSAYAIPNIQSFSFHAAHSSKSPTSPVCQISPRRALSFLKMQDGPDPLVFTSGHWLHRDAQQRDARTLDFDFNALCKKVVELCPGSRQVDTFEKAESGFNRVFLFLMDNGTRIVARIPFRIAGPAGLTTNSEVATMAYSEFFYPPRTPT
jgi:hypothetical protein